MKETHLKIGLVGAGVFGGYHANKLALHKDVTFQGVFDPDENKARVLSEKHGADIYVDVTDLYADCEAVIIACPAIYHGKMALSALEAGCHTLIEKPIATDLSTAEEIVALAKKESLIIQIGHQERFVARAIGLDKIKEIPKRIIAIRNTSYSARGTDTSVTLDLMTHDIDLCCMIMSSVPHSVSGASDAIESVTPDRARAELSFENGSAILSASRVEETVQRQMTLQYESGTILIDFVAKKLQHNTAFNLNPDFGQDPQAADSLGAATDSFISAILEGTPVSVSAQDGLNAAKIALMIDGDI